MNNYIEMRHHTGSSLFLFQKKVEGILNYLFPESWIPLYKMVAFTRIPYDECIRRAKEQDRLLGTGGKIVAGLAVALSLAGYGGLRPRM